MSDETKSTFKAPAAAGARAFTLIELIVVLAILATLVAASLPSFKGLKDQQIAREPLAALARLAKQARLHAIKERRPYQVVFTEKGFSATRYLSPYLQAVDLDKFLQQVQPDNPEEQAKVEAAEAEQQQQRDAAAADPTKPPPPPVFKEWTESYTLPEGSTYTVKFWHEPEPTQISGDVVKLWVFQPSGICEPTTVHLDRSNATFEASFNALTADITKEVSELK
jgi:prepilin-type N-terminal cleavage/methylation domain-containing protein